MADRHDFGAEARLRYGRLVAYSIDDNSVTLDTMIQATRAGLGFWHTSLKLGRMRGRGPPFFSYLGQVVIRPRKLRHEKENRRCHA